MAKYYNILTEIFKTLIMKQINWAKPFLIITLICIVIFIITLFTEWNVNEFKQFIEIPISNLKTKHFIIILWLFGVLFRNNSK